MKNYLLIFLIFFSQTGFLTFCAQEYVVGRVDMGQFGNQLFVIAATVSVALENNAIAVFPALATSKQYNIPKNYKKVFSHLNVQMPRKISCNYFEPHFHYAPISYRPNMRIVGYFQSEKYFARHKDYICRLFAPKSEIVHYLKDKYNWIIDHPLTVAIHYRSYSNESLSSRKAHPNCSLDYFSDAIAQFPEDALFVVFSNDISWCKMNFANIERNFYFVENEDYLYDFYLMSFCKHNIISNSSFSWWAAYLNMNPNKVVIAPSRWFHPDYLTDTQDVYPKSWIRSNVY